MRTRWEVDPQPFVALWVVLAFVVPAVEAIAAPPNKVPLYFWLTLGLLWGVPAAVSIVGCVVLGAVVLWNARPRRVTEPVLVDLRDTEREAQS